MSVNVFQPGETLYIGKQPSMRLSAAGAVSYPVASFQAIRALPLISTSGAHDWIGRPFLATLANGTWVMVYRSATGHVYETGARMHIRFSSNEGISWSDEDKTLAGASVTGFPIAAHSTNGVMDCNIILCPNNDLIVQVTEQTSVTDIAAGTWQYRSTDSGATWSSEGQLFSAAIETWGAQDFTIVGTTIYSIVLFLTSGETGSVTNDYVMLYKSDDNGATWTFVSNITTVANPSNETGIEYLNGTLLVVIRSNSGTVTWQRKSTDLGQTWGTLTDATASLAVLHRPILRRFTRYPNRIYAVGRDYNGGSLRPVVYYTDNLGTTWSSAFYPAGVTTYADCGYGDLIQTSYNQLIFYTYAGSTTAAALYDYLFADSIDIGGLATGLDMYWPGELSISGALADVHNAAQHLTRQNSVPVAAGKVGNALDLTAASSHYASRADGTHVSVGDIDFTIAFLARLDTKPASQMWAIGKYNGVGNQREYGAFWNNTNDRMGFIVSPDGNSTTTVVYAASQGALSTAAWYLVVIWHDSSLNTINIVCVPADHGAIVNGDINSTAHNGGVFNGTQEFDLGRQNSGSGAYWDGMTDEVAFWKNRLLSLADLNVLFNGGNGPNYYYVLSH